MVARVASSRVSGVVVFVFRTGVWRGRVRVLEVVVFVGRGDR
jgi:hypothetical protein